MRTTCLDVVVSAPDEKIHTTRSSVTLNMLFLQSFFEISLEVELRRITFEVNLPEWLVALTDLLNGGPGFEVERMLDLSGEKFIGSLSSDSCSLAVFDLVASKSVELIISHQKACALHSKLSQSLQSAIHMAAGRELLVSDIQRLELKWPGGAAII